MRLHYLYKESKILLRSIPVTVVTLFAVSAICMNLLANKTLVQLDWIAFSYSKNKYITPPPRVTL